MRNKQYRPMLYSKTGRKMGWRLLGAFIVIIAIGILWGIVSFIGTFIRDSRANKKRVKELLEDNERMMSANQELRKKIIALKTEEENNKLKAEALQIKIDSVDAFHNEFLKSTASNLYAIPYMASILSDYETYGIEILAKKLDWGTSVQRQKKVTSIREIRKKAQEMVQKNLESKYQLDYLLQLFPNLEDVIETDYSQLPVVDIADIDEYDQVRDWLSKEEYQNLSSTERNQLALDRYRSSHNKTKWQMGRDYELYVGYILTRKGYDVDFFGSYMGLEDLGRDLIAKKENDILIVQCKYWSKHKQIHEKHILQLYGTTVSYCFENNIPLSNVKGFLVSNISLSDMAKKMAKLLDIQYVENLEKGDYPCIKCNINYDEYGAKTKIYHLPFDQKYDATKINKTGEFYAMTVQEAENAGFRRALKWFGNN